MFAPHSFAGSLLTALLSMFCWGTWGNSLKLSEGKVRFEVYYADWTLACLLLALLAALTLGELPDQDGRRALGDLSSEMLPRMLFAFLAGLVFNMASILFMKGIGMLGLALAFPLCIGISLVLGTLVTYAVQPSGSLPLLILGVGLALAAVLLAAFAQHLKDSAQEAAQQPNTSDPGEMTSCAAVELPPAAAGPSFARKLCVAVPGGLLMGLWNPLVALAQQDGGISSYTEVAFFTLAMVLSSLLLVPLLLRWPLEGGPPVPLRTALAELAALPWRLHCLPLVGGAVWCLGTLANAVAGSSGQLSAAESYAIGQCANMVAVLWGALYFREFRGAPRAVSGLLLLIVLLYVAAISCIASASSS